MKKLMALMLSLGFTLSVATNPVLAEQPELTIYNQNFALVKDYRDITMKRGNNKIFLDNIAALIDPTSVHFKSLTHPDGVIVHEQNFRYDLINKTNILDRMVGEKIRFKKDGVIREGVLLNPVTNFVRPEYYPGRSQSYNTFTKTNVGEFAIETDEGVLLTRLNNILIDKLPEGLYPRPTLMWDLYSAKAAKHQSEISYLTDGITWKADYVAVLDDDDKNMDLNAWVTLDNQSGASFPDAKLKLVAGDVRKLKQGAVGGLYDHAKAARSMAMESVAKPKFNQESFFEYHLYTLDGNTTVHNNETKQLSLVNANSVPVNKKYIYDPDRVKYYRWYHTGWSDGYFGHYNYHTRKPGQGRSTSESQKVSVLMVLKNKKDHNLGMPLPKGKIRLHKADSTGSIQFIGEDWIDHTPKDEKIELHIGDAFDIVGEKKMSNYTKTSNAIIETFEVKLRNHKKQPITVNVMEHFFGDWRITQHSNQYKKVDAHTVSFPVSVAADGETKVTYTVQISRK